MSCRHCGAAISLGAKFCPACGAAQPPEPIGGGMPGYVPAPQGLAAAAPQPAASGVQKTTNGLAIAAMVLGIVWVYWVGSVLALIFGYIAKGQIRNSDGRQGGNGMAIAGIVLGWVGIGTLTLIIVLGVAGVLSK